MKSEGMKAGHCPAPGAHREPRDEHELLMAAIEGIDQIKAEMEADPAAFGKALAIAMADGYAMFKKDEEPAPAA